MADILSRSLTLTRYHSQELPKEIDIFARLKRFAFMSIDGNSNEYSFGWTNFDDYLDTGWFISSPNKDDYLCFSLRFDQRKIAPAIFKKEFNLAIEQEHRRLAEQGWRFISKDRKKEIKENVRLGLLSKTLPTPTWAQVIWHTQTNDIWLLSGSTTMNDIFSDLFCRTFEATISSQSDIVLDKLYDTAPIGEVVALHDFLTWLWYRADCGIPVCSDEIYNCTIKKAGKMTLKDSEKSDRCSVSGSTDVLFDAFSSMKHGKEVKKAQFCLSSDILFELDSDNPGKISLKNLPKSSHLEEGDDPDSPIYERFYLLEEVVGSIDDFFEEYLGVMSNAEKWNKEKAEIANWIKSDYE